MLRTVGQLTDSRNVKLDEQLAMLLYILSHYKKNRKIKTDFLISREMVSRYFNKVLKVILRLQGELIKSLEPFSANSMDEKWKCFKVNIVD
jgi:hypothetical protein